MERTIKPEDLETQFAGKLILDVRRVADRDAAPEHLPGAQRSEERRGGKEC